CLGVEMDPLDGTAENAALGVELLDRHDDAALVRVAAVGVLPARVGGDADHDGLLVGTGGRPLGVLLLLAGANEGDDRECGGTLARETSSRPDHGLPLQVNAVHL